MPALRRSGIVALVTLSALWISGMSWAQGGPSDSPERPARGLFFQELRPSEPGGPCDLPGNGEALLEIRDDGKVLGCTHGPDPAPAGVRVASAPTTAALRTMADQTGTDLPCIGDGTSGTRVQAVYAYPADRPDRFAQVAPLIEAWAAINVDSIFSASAAATGGGRRVRFVTDSTCHLVVSRVRVSATGDDTFANTITELRHQGFSRSDRKYMVWMDSPGPYCGIAQLYDDDSPSGTNLNNGNAGTPGMVARIDAPCWGSSGTPVEAHELMHTLGGIQDTAPHASGVGHCHDEADVMCYDDDGPGPASVISVCPATHERLFDCGHEDYFHTAPPPGSYLATHWNTATSRFLEVVPPEAPSVSKTITLDASRVRVRPGRRVRLTAVVAPCLPGTGRMLQLRSRGRMWVRPAASDCSATFVVRVRHRMAFQALSPAQGVDPAGATSPRVTVRTLPG